MENFELTVFKASFLEIIWKFSDDQLDFYFCINIYN